MAYLTKSWTQLGSNQRKKKGKQQEHIIKKLHKKINNNPRPREASN
jgi:hypothetical protein